MLLLILVRLWLAQIDPKSLFKTPKKFEKFQMFYCHSCNQRSTQPAECSNCQSDFIENITNNEYMEEIIPEQIVRNIFGRFAPGNLGDNNGEQEEQGGNQSNRMGVFDILMQLGTQIPGQTNLNRNNSNAENPTNAEGQTNTEGPTNSTGDFRQDMAHELFAMMQQSGFPIRVVSVNNNGGQNVGSLADIMRE